MHSLKPTECRRCGEHLLGSDPAPLRHQVWELPEIKPQKTEYQRHRLAWPGCGETTLRGFTGRRFAKHGRRATDGIRRTVDGLLQSEQVSYSNFSRTDFGQPCSIGWVMKLQNQATAAVLGAYKVLAAQLSHESVLSIDEIPTKEETAKSWLWTYVAKKLTPLAMRPSQEASGASDLLGKHIGVASMAIAPGCTCRSSDCTGVGPN